MTSFAHFRYRTSTLSQRQLLGGSCPLVTSEGEPPSSVAELDALFASLQHRAFRGDL